MTKICDGSGTVAGSYLELFFMSSPTVLVFVIQYLEHLMWLDEEWSKCLNLCLHTIRYTV